MSRGSSSFNTGQMSVGTTPVLIVPARATRINVTLSPSAAVKYAIGPASNVSLTTGLVVYNGSPVTLDTAADIYAVAESPITISFVEYY